MQTLTNVVVSASLLIAVGLGFGLIYQAGRFFHLAHGAILAFGGYAAWTFSRWLELGQWIAFPFAVVAATVLGVGCWWSVYRPIRISGGGPLALLIGGIGADLIIRNLLSIVFGDATLQVRSAWWEETVSLAGARLSMPQLGLIFLAVLSLVSVGLGLRGTRLGRELRAVGDSPELAESVGIDDERVLTSVFAVGSGLVAAAGLLMALDTDLRPMMGMEAMLLGIAASVVGGTRGVLGLLIAATGFAVIQHAGAWVIPVRWAEPLALVVLVLALCLRPHGLWSEGRRLE